MEPVMSFVLIVVLGFTATLPAPTLGLAEGSNVPAEDTPTATNMTREDNQCSPLQRRQDLMDNRMNQRDTRLNSLDTRLSAQLNTQRNEVNSRFNRMDRRLDGIETAISDMKGYLQARMEAMDKKVEWALTDKLSKLTDKPLQEATTAPPEPEVDTTAGPDTTPQADEPQRYTGCEDALRRGQTTSGVYTIHPDENNSFDVYCEQRIEGGGWTVFQNRYDGSVGFYNGWDAYKAGFGDLRGEFWLGNEKIHQLTKHHNTKLQIILTSPGGERRTARYSEFWLAPESDQYRITVTGYSGGTPPGDAMAHHNGQGFSTRDRDNDKVSSYSCATTYKGAWWYNTCHAANLNGAYGSTIVGVGLNWYQWKGHTVSMKATQMMFKTRP